MASAHDIIEFADRIVAEFHPQKIVLFGSYAYGMPTEDSDVDILVVTPIRGREIDKAVEIRGRLPHRFPLDLIVRSPKTLRQRIAWNDFFLREITEEGIVLYDATDRGVGRKGRRRLQRRLRRLASAEMAKL